MKASHDTAARSHRNSLQGDEGRSVLLAAALLAVFASGCGRLLDVHSNGTDVVACRDLLAGEWAGSLRGRHGISRTVYASYSRRPDGTYVASYETTIGAIVPVAHQAVHTAVQDGDIARFAGQSDWECLSDVRFEGEADGRVLRIRLDTPNGTQILRLYRVIDSQSPSITRLIAGRE